MKSAYYTTGVLAATLAVAAVALFAFAYTAYAQETEDSSTDSRRDAIEARQLERQGNRDAVMEDRQELRDERVEDRQEVRTDRQEDRTERMEERRTALEERLKTRFHNLGDNLTARAQRMIDRLTQIIERFETRMTALEERGVDVDEAAGHVDAAKDALGRAQAALNDIDVDAVVNAETPREALMELKDAFAAVRAALKEAHQALRDALAALKEVIREAGLDRGVSDAVRNSDDALDEDSDDDGVADSE